MKKKIMIHCSTNNGSSNFGDVLFAKMVLKYITDAGFEAAFYDLSDYFSDYLYNKQGLPQYRFSLKDADAALYFGGGYFGERKSDNIYQHLIHYRRFMRFGSKALNLKKQIAVIGIGAGEYLWKPSKQVVKKVCEQATFVTTRDSESTKYLKTIGISHRIETCTDIAQTLKKDNLIVNETMQFNPKKQYIYAHVSYKMDVAKLFAEGVKPFLESNPDVKVIIGADSILDINRAVDYMRSYLGHDRTIGYVYTTPDNLCWVLSQCSLVITYKLHVGIISATLSRSVIAFPKHEKVKRYYRQIGESNRLMNFEDATPCDVTRMIEEFWNKNIVLDSNTLELAEKNWIFLNSFLEQI